ncbi:LPXTG cell wall anchor domain-containing protein [Lactiplantibacillus sp. DA1]|uniref:LPXTG cell wall anchor domain-containing protein n=1 Tax=Lactiplantibacillus sp. DA1 TaxID=3079857 RepID=UPI00292A6167|nr:LPXTG cell wall anchor domain-containing protein [Lactiplantibacillus sp. DA1]MDV0432030.1 LPXTG cell wall anchor domain-containing protein [Lactiplantibacillus sp. DA1]
MLKHKKLNLKYEIISSVLVMLFVLSIFMPVYADNYAVGTTRISFVSKEEPQRRPESIGKQPSTIKHQNNMTLPQTDENKDSIYSWIGLNVIVIIIFLKLFLYLKR